MKALIMGELLVTVLAAITFLVIYTSDRVSPASHPGVRAARRHLIVTTLVGIGDTLGLFLLGVGVRLPLWLFALAYGAGAVVMVHRIVLVVRARRSAAL